MSQHSNKDQVHEPKTFPPKQGNDVRTLVNGNEIFPSMLEAIDDAEFEILIETYIYWNGTIGERFAKALAAASRRGVCVKVVLDDYGSQELGDRLVGIMKKGGVEIRFHRPIRWMQLRKSNHRSHRKLMIVDALVGFIGGVGIADEWDGDARDADEWRDNHYRIRGPVVNDMHTVFHQHWDGSSNLDPARIVPDGACHPPGVSRCQLIASDPIHGQEQFVRTYERLIREASQRIRIISPYFVPGDAFLDLVTEVAGSGVSVEIITSGEHCDRIVVRNASRYDWGTLLKSGVRVFEYNKTLIHAKLILVDDSTFLIGSANFDVRSQRINEEACLLVEDREMASDQARLFDLDRSDADEVRLEQWRSRPLTEKASDQISHWFRWML